MSSELLHRARILVSVDRIDPEGRSELHKVHANARVKKIAARKASRPKAVAA